MMNRTSSEHDDAAWLREVFDQYEGPLVRYAQRLLGDPHRACDVVQDTFVQLCRQPRSKVEKAVRQWLFAVCRNRAMDVLKKEHRMTALNDEQQAGCVSPEVAASERMEQRETAGQARAILVTLPTNQQEVIRLKVQEGLTYREISEVTGLSVSNVGFLLHRGLKTIRERMCHV
jgi:RNA polymerase sigma-70 factor (ECF subfamily)